MIRLLAGPFDGMAHATALADCSMDRVVRGCLLRLLEALLAPESAQQDDKARRAAAANGRAFVDAGGVQLAVDLVSGGWIRLCTILTLLLQCCAITPDGVRIPYEDVLNPVALLSEHQKQLYAAPEL